MSDEGRDGSARSGRGLAALCDSTGTVLDVLRDELGLAGRLAPGRPLTLVVDRGSLGKALSFLVDLRAQGAAFGWELNVPTAEGITTLQFAGGFWNASEVRDLLSERIFAVYEDDGRQLLDIETERWNMAVLTLA